MKQEQELCVVGWREFVDLPELGVRQIKAKIDTGARTSALHAFNLRVSSDHAGKEWVVFDIHPRQHNNQYSVKVREPVLEWRKVRSSNGKTERRPVIVTQLVLGHACWPIEVTLTRRDAMGFRLLLGRQALRGRVLVDVSQSFMLGREGK